MSELDVQAEGVPLTEAQDLWLQWQRDRSSAVRTQLFFHYSQWARMIAGHVMARYPHPLAEWSDYVNLSSLGLLQAIDRFDLKHQVRFETYAEPCLRGAILKGLSCYVKDRQPVSRDRLESMIGEGRFGDGDSDLERVVNAAVDLAFGYFLELGVVSTEPVDNSPLSIYEQASRDHGLDLMVQRLPERERQVVVGHYYQHMSFVELSQLMGVSKSRVSQLHAQALRRVRKLFEAQGEMDEYF